MRLLTLLAILFLFSFAHAETAPDKPDTATSGAFNTLLAAIQMNDYDGALIVMDDTMRASFTKEVFERVKTRYTARLKSGYEAIYLDYLQKKGFRVHLWKLTFKDKSDDVLAELSLKDGKVDGLWLRG